MKTEWQEYKGSRIQQDITTVSLYWQLLIHGFPSPPDRFIARWCKLAPLEEVMKQVEFIAYLVRKGHIQRADEAGRRITAYLSQQYGQQTAQVSA